VSIHKWSFFPISALALPAQWNAFEVLIPSGWNAEPIPLGLCLKNNPRNITHMRACPDRFFIGVLIFVTCLDFEQIF
jgi:hypothetical protein